MFTPECLPRVVMVLPSLSRSQCGAGVLVARLIRWYRSCAYAYSAHGRRVITFSTGFAERSESIIPMFELQSLKLFGICVTALCAATLTEAVRAATPPVRFTPAALDR